MKIVQIISKWTRLYTLRNSKGAVVKKITNMAQVIVEVEGQLVTRHIQLKD